MATAPFDADDLMRRSFFSSIMGLRPPKKSPTKPEKVPLETSFRESTSSQAIFDESLILDVAAECALFNHGHRSRDDIFREIVCECAEIELRNNQSKPEQTPPSATQQLCTHCHCTKRRDQQQQQQQQQQQDEIKVKQETTNTLLTVEEFMKLFVTAVKESALLGSRQKKSDQDESPEAILRRKRAQNNEAAIRYRKRQRESRRDADVELTELIAKNRQLKTTVTEMQNEIDRLKQSLLNRPVK